MADILIGMTVGHFGHDRAFRTGKPETDGQRPPAFVFNAFSISLPQDKGNGPEKIFQVILPIIHKVSHSIIEVQKLNL